VANHANVLGKHVLECAETLNGNLFDCFHFEHQVLVGNNDIEVILKATVQQGLCEVRVNLSLETLLDRV